MKSLIALAVRPNPHGQVGSGWLTCVDRHSRAWCRVRWMACFGLFGEESGWCAALARRLDEYIGAIRQYNGWFTGGSLRRLLGVELATTPGRTGRRSHIIPPTWGNTCHRWWSLVAFGLRLTAWRRPDHECRPLVSNVIRRPMPVSASPPPPDDIPVVVDITGLNGRRSNPHSAVWARHTKTEHSLRRRIPDFRVAVDKPAHGIDTYADGHCGSLRVARRRYRLSAAAGHSGLGHATRLDLSARSPDPQDGSVRR